MALGVSLAGTAALIALGSGGAARRAGAQGPATAPVLISELRYDPPPSGSEAAFEWVELHNPGEASASLAGWRLADNRAETVLPDAGIEPGGYLVVAGSRFGELHPGFEHPLLTVPRIGNGLGNAGDRLQLLDAQGRAVDGLSYGDDAALLDPPAPLAQSGHSLARVPAGEDSDTAADWRSQPTPSPGEPNEAPPPPTAVPPPPTLAPGARPRLNELLPAPRDVDWDGDGTADRDDEWVELFNAGDEDLDLRGWQLDDVAGGGSPPFALPDGLGVPARGHLLLFKRETGVSLNNGGDELRLLAPDGTLVDALSYGASAPDASWARAPDGEGGWRDDLAPSPGGPNGSEPAASATPDDGPTPGPSSVPTAAPSASPTSGPGPSPGPSMTPGPTPDGTATPDDALYLPLLISEVLFDPLAGGVDAAEEWVELFNAGGEAVDLAGWSLEDGGGRDVLPSARIAPGGFLVVAATAELATRLGALGAATVAVEDGRIGAGLGNEGDLLRLRGPDGREADALSWGDELAALDPPVPRGPPGATLERIPPDRDRDLADDWWIQPAPSPGRAGRRHEGPPALRLSEVLPAPSLVDWDGDGSASHLDEWIELHNPEPYAAALDGWRLEVPDDEGDAWFHRFPAEARVPAGGWLVVPRAESRLALRNDGDALRLVRPDGVVADRFAWSASPGYDRSLSRRGPDEAAGWASDWAVTPGGPNRPLAPGERHLGDAAWEAERARRYGVRAPRAPAPPQEASFAVLRSMRPRTRVLLRGRVLAAPGVLGTRAMYVGDEAAGIRVYLRPRDRELPPFQRGDGVALIGRLGDFRGERELRLDRPEDAWWDGKSGPVVAAPHPTGGLGEAAEGRLLRVSGRLVEARRTRWTLDDGSGPMTVGVSRGSGIAEAPVQRGAWLTVTGLASQSASRAPWVGGYRLRPRDPADLRAGRASLEPGGSGGPPSALPRTGRAPDGGIAPGGRRAGASGPAGRSSSTSTSTSVGVGIQEREAILCGSAPCRRPELGPAPDRGEARAPL